jgi:hypothetical protein
MKATFMNLGYMKATMRAPQDSKATIVNLEYMKATFMALPYSSRGSASW